MTTERAQEAPQDAAWLSTAERGAIWGIRLVFALAVVFGRRFTRAFVSLLAAWYATFDRPARLGSRAWFERSRGRPARWLDVFGHVQTFVHVTLDRIYLLRGKTQGFEVTRTGNHHLEALATAKQGAILLGAHLGSFEAMRVGASEESFPVNIVGHFENAKMINALLEKLNPEFAGRVIHVGADPLGVALRLKDAIEAGEMVAILGDRTGLNDKVVTVDFMGSPADFPAGPFLLAHVLQCPVYLVFGLYSAPNTYDLFCEPFVDRVELPRRGREQKLTEIVQAFAARLEDYALRAPDNWFNFYDFWASARSREDQKPPSQSLS